MHTAPHHYTTYTKKTNLSCVFISYKIDIILQFWREYFNFRFFYHEFRLLEKFHYIHNKFFTIGREIVNIFFCFGPSLSVLKIFINKILHTTYNYTAYTWLFDFCNCTAGICNQIFYITKNYIFTDYVKEIKIILLLLFYSTNTFLKLKLFTDSNYKILDHTILPLV